MSNPETRSRSRAGPGSRPTGAAPRLLAAAAIGVYAAVASLPCRPPVEQRIAVERPAPVEPRMAAAHGSGHTMQGGHAHAAASAMAQHAGHRGHAPRENGASGHAPGREAHAEVALTAPCMCGCDDHTGARSDRAPLAPALARASEAIAQRPAAAPRPGEVARLPAPPLDPIEHVPIPAASLG